jgi:hypothetical protein
VSRRRCIDHSGLLTTSDHSHVTSDHSHVRCVSLLRRLGCRAGGSARWDFAGETRAFFGGLGLAMIRGGVLKALPGRGLRPVLRLLVRRK